MSGLVLVEKQAQYGPDRLNKSRAESNKDQLARLGSDRRANRLLEAYDPRLVGS